MKKSESAQCQALARRDLLRHHRTLLGPAWRSLLVARGLPRCTAQDDWWLRDLARFDGLLAEARENDAMRQFPSIAAAKVVQANVKLAARAKVMTLGDLPIAEIAERLALESSTIEAWEKISFDVRDLRAASGWLFVHVIGREREGGDHELAAAMKLAIASGPDAVRLWLDAEAGIPLDEADRLFCRSLRLHLMSDAAIEMPLESEAARLRFLKLFAKIQSADKRLQLDRDRLAQRCVESQRRHELALLRAGRKPTDNTPAKTESQLRPVARGA